MYAPPIRAGLVLVTGPYLSVFQSYMMIVYITIFGGHSLIPYDLHTNFSNFVCRFLKAQAHFAQEW